MSTVPSPNPTVEVNPSSESVAALWGRPDEGPIIMVNLLRFVPGGGREAYARYGAVASGTVRARGGSVAYTAPVIEGDSDWDTVTLVRYPRRAAYLDMQTDPAYVGAIPDRTAGLSARLLYPFYDPDGGPEAPLHIERPTGEGVVVVSLHSVAMQPMNGEVVLRLVADMPMVSDQLWSELVVARFDSMDAAVAANSSGDGDVIQMITRP